MNEKFNFFVKNNQVKINIDLKLKENVSEKDFVKSIGEILTKYCDLTFSYFNIDEKDNIIVDYYNNGKQYKNHSLIYTINENNSFI